MLLTVSGVGRPTFCRSTRRLLSTTTRTSTSPTFSSYFFDNARWDAAPSRTTRSTLQPAGYVQKPSAHSVAAQALPLSAYKAIPNLKPKVYLELAKSRLTALVVLTAMSGVALSPLPTSVPILLSTALGTTLCSASANTFNQVQEVPFDAQMARTRNRPLCRHAITPTHASNFAIAAGVGGVGILWAFVNPLTAALGGANIVLYSGIYTWMKRKTVWNTWVGSVVGGIPPVMGWTACGGTLLPSSEAPIQFFLPSFMTASDAIIPISAADNPLAPLTLFLFLFAWQYAHFNPLSYLVRGAYAQAGYRMQCVLDPVKCARNAFRFSVFMTLTCAVLVPLSGLTTWWFSLTSLAPNLICLKSSWDWYKQGGEARARSLMRQELLYLPIVMGLMMVHKHGLEWGKWLGLSSESDEEEEVTNKV